MPAKKKISNRLALREEMILNIHKQIRDDKGHSIALGIAVSMLAATCVCSGNPDRSYDQAVELLRKCVSIGKELKKKGIVH